MKRGGQRGNAGKLKHGMIGRPEYNVWRGMRQRCRNPLASGYKDYGGRGIKVCKRWDSFRLFLADMGPRPTPKHTIDRENSNGNYEPGNCRWATRKEQAKNTPRGKLLRNYTTDELLAELMRRGIKALRK